MNRETVLSHWDRYVQAPEELAFSRVRRFPRHAMDRLAPVLGVRRSDRVLEVGSGVGILSSHLGCWLQASEQMVALEPNARLRNADLPRSIRYDPGVEKAAGKGEAVPFSASQFDVVLSHTLFNVLPDDTRERVLDEMIRVLKPNGMIVAMDGVAGARHRPEGDPAEEALEKTVREFQELHQTTHEALHTGLYNTFQAMPEWFDRAGFNGVETRGWFQPCRLSDDVWSDRQRSELIDLEFKAGQKRVETLGRLLRASGRWDPEHKPLFERMRTYHEKRYQQARKTDRTDRESGWSGGAVLVVRGSPSL